MPKPNPWHPALPTSAKARRMIYESGGTLFLDGDGECICLSESDNWPNSRYSIGTVAAKLCREMDIWGEAVRWDRWSEGKDWR